MQLTKQQSREQIIALKLPQVILDIFDGKELPDDIRYDFGCPEEYFMCSEAEQAPWSPQTVIPLFSDQDFYTVYAYNTEKKGFVIFETESETDPATLPVQCWEALFVEKIVEWWEAELSDDEIREVGELLGLRHTADLVKSIPEGGFETFELVQEWAQEKRKYLNAQ